MVFGEFFPNPGGHPLTSESRQRVSTLSAFVAELVGTAVLLLVIFTDPLPAGTELSRPGGWQWTSWRLSHLLP